MCPGQFGQCRRGRHGRALWRRRVGRDSYHLGDVYGYDNGTNYLVHGFGNLGSSGTRVAFFAGYGVAFKGSHFAVEAEYGTSSADLQPLLLLNNVLYVSELEPRGTFGASLIYGFPVMKQTFLYGRVGWVQTKFRGPYGGDVNLDGARFGGGVERLLTDRVSLRVEYAHTNYGSLTYVYAANSAEQLNIEGNTLNLGVVVHF